MPEISPDYIQKLAATFCALIMTGLFTLNFLPTLSTFGVIGLLLTALFYLVMRASRSSESKAKLTYIVLIGVFLIHLASGFNTDIAHRKEFWADVVLQLPFLLMPLSFALLPSWPTHYLHYLYLLFFSLVVLSALGSTGNYLLHTTEINNLYSQSQIMPTVPDYIRFSLMVAFAIVIGILLIANNVVVKHMRWWVIGSTTFLTLYLYLLAVRSGLGAFNALGILAVGWLIFKKGSYKQAALLGAILIALPVLSFVCFPTFRNKYYNTQYDVAQVQTTSSANNLSLVGRYYSYKVGLQLVRQHPWFGVGKADMEQEVGRFYKRDYVNIDPSSYLMPHNQFLYYWAAFGGIGLIAFVFCFYYPLFKMWQQTSLLLVTHYLIISLSFLAEFTLDQKNQVGLIYSLLFILLPLATTTSNDEERHELKFK